MYQYIKGKIEDIGESFLILDNNDIGYFINTSKNTIYNIDKNLETVKIFTHLHVREDDISIYGFYTMDELDMFNLLLTVSKIGPKVALGVLSTMTPSNIKFAILNDDQSALSKCPGIGKKTASRMILELKDKIDKDITVDDENILINTLENDVDEAVGALISLGYTSSEARNVLSKIDSKNLSTEDIIKYALKELAK